MKSVAFLALLLVCAAATSAVAEDASLDALLGDELNDLLVEDMEVDIPDADEMEESVNNKLLLEEEPAKIEASGAPSASSSEESASAESASAEASSEATTAASSSGDAAAAGPASSTDPTALLGGHSDGAAASEGSDSAAVHSTPTSGLTGKIPSGNANNTAPVAGSITSTTIPMYAYWNKAIKDHLYTTNPAELGRGKGDWEYQGVAAVLAAEPKDGTVKLLRYLNMHNLDHVYVTEPIAEDANIRNEGYEGYIYTKAAPGLGALYEYYSEENKDHMYSTATSHPAGYQKTKVVGYVKLNLLYSKPAEHADPKFKYAGREAIPAKIPAQQQSPYTAPPANDTLNKEVKFWAPHPADKRLVPVFRYWNPALRDHFYTTNYDLLGNGKHGWRYQGIQMYIFPTQVNNAVIPLYRYWNLKMGDHFYTTDFNDLGSGKDGYAFKGVLGYVHKTAVNGTVALHRFFNKQIGDHFYTTNSLSKARGAAEWTPEGIAAFVFPVPNPNAGKGNHYGLLVPLYRYWNRRYADHFYTTIWREVQTGTHGWEYQGIQCLVYAAQQSHTVPLHRYWNIRTLDHFYTTNFQALGKGGKDGWKYEGVEGYVDVYRQPGTVGLYRYFNEQLKDHFYTTKWLGRTYRGWNYEGLQAYVHRTPQADDDKGAVKAPDGMKTLYRYWSSSRKDHVYTTNFGEFKEGKDGYSYEGVESFIYADNTSGGKALHRYFNSRINDHFYTTDFSILKKGGEHGWEYEGITGYVKDSQDPGTERLYRYYNKEIRDHFYTVRYMGKAAKGYELQGTAGFVAPYKTKLHLHAISKTGEKLGAADTTPSTAQVHEYYNPVTKDHYYTTDYSKLENGQHGWEYQGVIGSVLKEYKEGTIKLRQYFSAKRKDHRYTVRHVSGGDWKYEGAVGFIHTESKDGDSPLYAFENEKSLDNALSTSRDGVKGGTAYEKKGYKYQETLGYLLKA
eukprot:TRINITY_DN3607_c0_g1_i2.p1 TRINITY_DN3607_c0_g1~~TRINITY_DN3607_c0_g1_i2.p1  ORF type:complete len:958 (+),score=374.42 TRINITY_DN3607_c0_g1_i2:382-3255(+)